MSASKFVYRASLDRPYESRVTPMTTQRIIFLIVVLLLVSPRQAFAQIPVSTFDLVIAGGRVIDPESNLNDVRHVGITGGVIQSVSSEPLRGRHSIDASGLIVAPGFIDLHSHGQSLEIYRAKAHDGVTTALEMEIGVGNVDDWYAERANKAPINYGVTVGHIPIRMTLMKDPGEFLPAGPAISNVASADDIGTMKARIREGLAAGALGVGFGIGYTPAASAWEILEMFRVAGEFKAPCYVHLRGGGEATGVESVAEVLAASAITGAPLHVVHINSTGGDAVAKLLGMILQARDRGMDVTTEAYPYTASATRIESALFSDGWQERRGISYGDVQWTATGERLTEESFKRFRRQGGPVIVHGMREPNIRFAVSHPEVMIASDGRLLDGKGHPRSSGTFARVLGRYVREQQAMTWMDAVRKMSLLPAQRLEGRVPAMKNKGRIRVGADADITVFDPETVADQATYEQPARYSSGIPFVLVGGNLVIDQGRLQENVLPGKAVRAARQ